MNFQLSNKKFVKILFIITTISFLWLGIFGLFNHMGGMQSDNMVSKCLFNGQTEMCTMSFSEHSTLWQWMMTTLPREVGLLSLLVLTTLLTIKVIFSKNSFFEFIERVTARRRLYIKQHPQMRLFGELVESFSGGILNSKIYA